MAQPTCNIPRWHWPVTVILLTLLVGGYYVGVKGEERSAINRWRPVLKDFIAGEDIYQKHAFPTPPIMAIVLVPFAILPGKWAMATWFGFKAGLTIVSFYWLWRVVNSSDKSASMTLKRTRQPAAFERPPIWLAVVAVSLSFRPVLGDLLHGNVNLWILFLVVASIICFRARFDVLAGVTLAFAIACKVTPALLLAYFAWKRQWSIVSATMVGLLLWLVFVPAAVLGFTRNTVLLDHWANQMLAPYVVAGQVDAEQINQSLPGLFARLATPTVAIEATADRPAISVNIVDLDPAHAWLVLRCVLFCTVTLLAMMCRGRWAKRTDAGWLQEICLVLLGMLLLSERSWKSHYVILSPSYFLLTVAAWTHFRMGRLGRACSLTTLIGLSAFLIALTSSELGRPLLGPSGPKLAQAYGSYVLAAVVLAIAHASELLGASIPRVVDEIKVRLSHSTSTTTYSPLGDSEYSQHQRRPQSLFHPSTAGS